jgi:hypothetical protein
VLVQPVSAGDNPEKPSRIQHAVPAMLRSRRSLLVLGLAAAVAVLGWSVLRGGPASPPAGTDSAAGPGSAATSPAPPPQSAAPPQEGDNGGGDIGDVLEPANGQLVDMLGHLQTSCAAAAPPGGAAAGVSALTQCAQDAEGVMNLVDLLHGTIEGPAGAAMPQDVQKRWEGTLAQATATVRQSVTPVWDAVGRRLASGGGSPAEFRALGHLRDRLGRVLAAAAQP